MAAATDGSKNAESLWVSRVVSFSSQYDSVNWGANKIIGSPKVYPEYGDIPGAWAQGNRGNNEYIEVAFEKKLYIEEVNIYETYNGGAVKKISCLGPGGEWVSLWETDNASHVTSSRIFSPTIPRKAFSSKQLRLEIDCSASGGHWCELDAVQIKGRSKLVDAPPPVSELSDDLKKMVQSPQFSDISFEVEGKIVPGHRVILAARSNYFRALFSDKMMEGGRLKSKPLVIEIPDVSHGAFVGMMQYIYSNTLEEDIDPLSLVELVRVGDRFSLDGLMRLAHFKLVDRISLENVVTIYTCAANTLPVLDGVKNSCADFMACHMDQVTKTKAFCELPQKLMLDIVQAATARLNLK